MTGGAAHRALLRHLIETTARHFLPHPRHRSRFLRSRTFAAGLSPALSRDLRRQQRDGVASGAVHRDEIPPRPRSSIRAARTGKLRLLQLSGLPRPGTRGCCGVASRE
jgi:hypothetical protein